MTISGYAPTSWQAAVDSHLGFFASSGWRIFNCELKENNVGFAVGANSLIENVLSHHNRMNGGGGGGAEGTIIRYSAFIYNNRDGVPDPMSAFSGSKSAMVRNAQILNNYFADNEGIGYWCDIDCKDSEWINIISVRNSVAGIMTEIDGGGVLIKDNISLGNGWGHNHWASVGILLSSSHHVTVVGNYSLRNRNGSIVLWWDYTRADEGGGTVVYNNIIDEAVYNNSTPDPQIYDNVVLPAAQIVVPKMVAGPQM